jgi:hypothetical protein
MTILPNSSVKYTFQIEKGENIWLSLSLIVSLKLLSIVQRVVVSVPVDLAYILIDAQKS